MTARSTTAEAQNKAQTTQGRDWGYDLVEMTSHSPTCLICAMYQGRVYAITKEAANGKYKAPDGTPLMFPYLYDTAFAKGYETIHPNCRHRIAIFPARVYTKEKLREFSQKSTAPFEDTRTDQERKVYAEQQAEKRRRNANYKQYERIKAVLPNDAPKSFAGFVRMKQANSEKYQELMSDYRYIMRSTKQQNDNLKMSNHSPTDLSTAKPIQHSKEELADIVKYANSKNIHIYHVENFDGDTSIIKGHIDALYEIRNEYNLTNKLTIHFADMENGDLAETHYEGYSMIFDRAALRDRDLTNQYLQEDNYLATNDVKGIAYHETGHLISKKYGEKGFDIAKRTYYNIYKEDISDNDLRVFLEENISEYSTYIPKDKQDKSFKAKYYKEITPEILSKDKTNPDEFTKEFVRLLKGACGL